LAVFIIGLSELGLPDVAGYTRRTFAWTGASGGPRSCRHIPRLTRFEWGWEI